MQIAADSMDAAKDQERVVERLQRMVATTQAKALSAAAVGVNRNQLPSDHHPWSSPRQPFLNLDAKLHLDWQYSVPVWTMNGPGATHVRGVAVTTDRIILTRRKAIISRFCYVIGWLIMDSIRLTQLRQSSRHELACTHLAIVVQISS